MEQAILITGVSSGLGLGLARFYVTQNYQVYGINRKPPEDPIHSAQNFHFIACDLTEENAVRKKLPQLLRTCSQLDRVVLNAGVLNELKDMRDTPLSEIRKVMEINTWANKTVIDTLNSLDLTIHQIVAISSGASISGNRGWNAYSLSKAALNMLIKLYAEELPQIHFCALAPGLVDTAMQDYICALENEEQFPVVKRLKSCRGTELMPTPDEAASRLHEAFAKVMNYDSGSYLDVRQLDN